MKKIFVPIIGILLFASCGEEKSALEQMVDLRCDCLSQYDKEKDNIMEVLNCANDVSDREEFKDVDQNEVTKLMMEKCPNAGLPDKNPNVVNVPIEL